MLIRGVCKVIYRIRVDKRLRLIKENYQKQLLIDKGLVKYEVRDTLHFHPSLSFQSSPMNVAFPDSFIQPNRTVAYKKTVTNNGTPKPVELVMNSYKTYRAKNVVPVQIRNTHVPFTLPTKAEFALSIPWGHKSSAAQSNTLDSVEHQRFFNKEIKASSRVEAFMVWFSAV